MTATTLDPCPDMIALLGAHALGALEPEPAARLDAHLDAGCAGCRALRDELEAELDAARLPEEDPAPGGWERVLVRLDGAAPGAEGPPAVRLRCAYCHDDLRRAEAACCAACLAPHHPDCFAEHGRCAAPGCQETRTLRASEPTALAPTMPRRRRRGGAAVWIAGLACGVGGMAAWGQWRPAPGEDAEVASSDGPDDLVVADVPAYDQGPTAPTPTYGGLTLPQWIDRLGDHSPAFRQEASRAIGSLGQEGLAALERAIHSDSTQRRLGVLETVFDLSCGDDGRPQAGGARIVLIGLQDRASSVRTQAALILTRDLTNLGPLQADARRLLLELAQGDPDAEVRLHACQALKQLAPDDPAALEALARAVESDPSERVRLGLVHPLSQVAPPTTRSVAALIEALAHDAQPTVRRAAAEALALPELHEALVPTVCRALAASLRGEEDRDVRELAASSMQVYPAPAHDLEALLAASQTTPAATWALAAQPPAALAAFLSDLERRPAAEQAAALDMVCLVSDDREQGQALVPVLARYLERASDSGLRASAARRIWSKARLGRPAPPEADLPLRALQSQALRALEGAVPDLAAELIGAPTVDDVEILTRLGLRASAAADALTLVARSGPIPVRVAALLGLEQVAPDAPGTQALLAHVLREEADVEQLLSAALLVAQRLGARAAPLASAVAEQLGTHRRQEQRRLALSTLGAMQLGAEAVRLLEPRLTLTAETDPDPRCRELARLLLRTPAPAPAPAPVSGQGE